MLPSAVVIAGCFVVLVVPAAGGRAARPSRSPVVLLFFVLVVPAAGGRAARVQLVLRDHPHET